MSQYLVNSLMDQAEALHREAAAWLVRSKRLKTREYRDAAALMAAICSMAGRTFAEIAGAAYQKGKKRGR